MSHNLSFLFAFICSIGFYRLFYSINRPAAKWRSITLLLLCLLERPLVFLWKDVYMGYVILPVYASVIIMIYGVFILLAIVLLSANRRRALVCAAFVLSLVFIIEIPIIYFICAIIRPSLSMMNFIEETYQISKYYYSILFINNSIIMCCCFFAAHWLRKTQVNPPRNLIGIFSMVFISMMVIFFIWARDIATVVSVSFLPTGLLAALFAVLQPVIFYFFTRLIANKEDITSNVKNMDFTQFVQQLSKRELEVIEAVLAGYVRQKELAASLNISVNTVKTHLKNIYQTTGISSVDALSLLFRGYTPTHPKITPKSS
jgi:DNA-binding CsgD family transcriptional regulator/uncharacterized membrane protein